MKIGLSFHLACILPLAFVLAGCSVATTTNPARSVTEQLLLSTAADRAINATVLTNFAHQKVFVDATYFDSYDSKYVVGSIRDALSRAGGLLVSSETNSDIIIEARSGGLSIDSSSGLIGIPNTGLPIPLAGVLNIPELALYKVDRQYSTAKLALLAYATHSREHYYSSGPMVGKSYNKYYKLLGFIQWTMTDIPEKKKPKKKSNN
jgi:hypothetical protein